MATVIDSLVMRLGFDSSGFTKGKNEARKGLEELGKSGDGLQKGFSDTAKSLAGFVAVLGGSYAIKQFIRDVTESNAALGRMAQNLGLSANGLSQWGGAATLAGGNAEGLQSTMQMLSKAQTEMMLTGNTALVPYFSMMGQGFSDASGKARSLDDMLLGVSDSVKRMYKDRSTQNNVLLSMGIDQGTANLLLKTRKEVEQYLARSKELGIVTQHQAQTSAELKLRYDELKQSFGSLGRELLETATPALVKLAEWLTNISQWAREHGNFVTGTLGAIAVAVGAMAIAALPISVTVMAIAALAAAIGALYDDFKTWQDGGDALLPWSSWMPSINATIEAVRSLSKAIGWLFDLFIGKPARVLFGIENNAPAVNQTSGKIRQNGQGNAMQAMDLLLKEGLSPMQAAGMAAQFAAESKFNPQAIGDNGDAFGIAQWHPKRQADFAQQFGKPIQQSSFAEQVKFAAWELKNTERNAGNKLSAANSANESGNILSRLFERPAKSNQEAIKRGQLAEGILSQYNSFRNSDRMGGVAKAGNSSQISTNVGEVKVYTAATDAAGIARDLSSSLSYSFAAQANAGME